MFPKLSNANAKAEPLKSSKSHCKQPTECPSRGLLLLSGQLDYYFRSRVPESRANKSREPIQLSIRNAHSASFLSSETYRTVA
jgi:hypothetical protein